MNRSRMVLPRAWCCLILGVAAGCTDASLYGLNTQPNLADRISFAGEICTDDPSAVAFPVKILIVMDGTAELVSADPMAQRASALEAVLSRYSGPNYHYGIVQFASQGRSPTGGFARDVSTLQAGVDTISIGTPDTQRSYLDALRVLTTAIQDDVLASTPGQRSRTRYVVLFVAHGAPSPDLEAVWCTSHMIPPVVDNARNPDCQSEFSKAFCPDDTPVPASCEDLLYPRLVRDLRKFVIDNGAQDLVFHAFSLRSAPGAMDAVRAESIMTEMVIAGHGVLESQTAGQLNLLATDLAVPSSRFVRREFVVYNPNAALRTSRILPDSDADGLADEEEMTLGTNPLSADTDADRVGDAIERLLAAPGLEFDPVLARTPTECDLIDPPDKDTDSDGLSDCEEAVLRTDPSLVDTDKDGIPDLVEVRRRGNPLVDDALDDTDFDGVANGAEIKSGLDVSSNDASSELEFGYRYRFFDEGLRMQLEGTPNEPIPGVTITFVDGSMQGPARLCYTPGPPRTLAFAEGGGTDCSGTGPAVDVSRDVPGSTFTLTSLGTQAVGVMQSAARDMRVKIDRSALPGDPRQAQVLLRVTARHCFHFDVRNISLVQTREVPGGRPGEGWNNLRVYLAELPEDAPKGHSIFNVATVPVRFVKPDQKTPNVPFIKLDQGQFLLLGGDL